MLYITEVSRSTSVWEKLAIVKPHPYRVSFRQHVSLVIDIVSGIFRENVSFTSELPKPSCLRSRDWRNVETLDRESSHAKKIIRCPVMFRTESPKTLLLQNQTCQIGIWGKYSPPLLNTTYWSPETVKGWHLADQ